MFQFGQNLNLDPLFENDYCYDRLSTFYDTVYVQCHEKISKKCFAKGSIINNGPIVLTTEHNHSANPDLKLVYDFKKDLYLAVISNFDQLRKIYNDISVKHLPASSCVPYIKISKTMYNWRKTIIPPIPKTLEEYYIFVTSDKWKHLLHSANSPLTVTNVYGDDGSIATVFYDSVFLRNFQSVRIFADATFKICPRLSRGKIYQFFTIMIAVNDTVWSLLDVSKPSFLP
ncbi:hypothetical protein KQX54_019337 [Cotesia glomerata]|uniref:Uncharacterized protein n=1 Tax=Cotesia glomerata TaxID=32391 RepID=A0AAV7IQQ5_COTGL|nr:hypothetical protein KQX54_019337 [Cotesia glomerata]